MNMSDLFDVQAVIVDQKTGQLDWPFFGPVLAVSMGLGMVLLAYLEYKSETEFLEEARAPEIELPEWLRGEAIRNRAQQKWWAISGALIGCAGIIAIVLLR